jgi:hypothetical protein
MPLTPFAPAGRTLRRAAPPVLALLCACSPALDWREVRPDGAAASLMLPCKPASHARKLRLAGAEVKLTLYACNANGATWAIGFADMADPALVTPALQELASSASGNVASSAAAAPRPWAPPGATPNLASQRLSVRGQLPDGKAVQMEAGVFAVGTQVLQASHLAAKPDAEAVAQFFEQIKVRP